MSEFAPSAGHGPGGHRLIAGLLLLEHASEFVPADEALVERALDPLWLPRVDSVADTNAGFIALLRTAGYFILSSDQVQGALESEPPIGIPAFPPLPFRRIWIETHKFERGTDVPATYMRYIREATTVHGVELPEEIIEIVGIGIVEVVARREWDVYVASRFKRAGSTRGRVVVAAYRITPSEIVMPKLDYVSADTALRTLLTMAINGAHLITARNVPHHEIVLPRAQRRRMARSARWAAQMPKLYYVDLEHSGEPVMEGAPHRTLHCRFLVRGHWRHLDNGPELCTCFEHRFSPLPATPVEPHVRGPRGAPWKGRPIHRSKAAA